MYKCIRGMNMKQKLLLSLCALMTLSCANVVLAEDDNSNGENVLDSIKAAPSVPDISDQILARDSY